jgi:hypothetical protein
MVDRKNVFEEVMVLYTDDREKVLSEYPLFIRFKGELGVDLGGVTQPTVGPTVYLAQQ